MIKSVPSGLIVRLHADTLLYRKRLTLYVSLLANSDTVLRVAEEELGLCNYMELHF